MTESKLSAVFTRFAVEGEIGEIIPFGEGHINGTFRVTMKDGTRYILQAVNNAIFKNTDGLMKNISEVTAYLRAHIAQTGGDPSRETMSLVPTAEGKTHFYDEDGTPWRAYTFIKDTVTYQSVEKPEDFYFSAKAFAAFTAMLDGYPAQTLTETIPAFHNTKIRFYNLVRAMRKDAFGRAASVQKELDFALDRIEKAGFIVDAIEDGRIPLRVTHNDTKLNNVLIDKASGKAICVCDLDTIMPGSILYDFGDAIRFGCNPVSEDDPHYEKAICKLDLFDAYVKGTMEVLSPMLTPTEIDYLPLGAWMMTLECGVRFLTDYLEGDTYFKTSRTGQNLDRCHTQFAMVADMERKEAEMKAIVDKYR